MARIEFRKIRQFVTSNLELLSKQLDTLESNIAAALQDADSGKLNTFTALPRFTAANAKPITVGQLAEFDTTGGAIVCMLERPSRAMAGQLVAIVCRVTAAPITVRVAPPVVGGVQGKINASGSINIAAAGLKLTLCDGVDWWST